MAVNRDRPDFWKEDIAKSVDFYNKWFIEFAPWTYRDARQHTTEHVKSALALTKNLTDISSPVLKGQPYVVQILRMTTAPPIARDRLMGLSGVPPLLISSMEEKNRIPPKMKPDRVDHELAKIGRTIEKMLDKDLFPWIETEKKPSKDMIYRGATVVADRLTGAVANPIIRNAQERRQLAAIKKYLENRGYQHIKSGTGIKFSDMSLATFAFRLNVPVKLEGGKAVNIPVDVAIRPKDSKGVICHYSSKLSPLAISRTSTSAGRRRLPRWHS